MADFGGLASVLQMQNQGIQTATKQTKHHSRKRSLESNDDPNARVNSKLLQLLKENQEDFRVINGTSDPSQQMTGPNGVPNQNMLMMPQDYLLDNFDYRQGYDDNSNYVS